MLCSDTKEDVSTRSLKGSPWSNLESLSAKTIMMIMDYNIFSKTIHESIVVLEKIGVEGGNTPLLYVRLLANECGRNDRIRTIIIFQFLV